MGMLWRLSNKEQSQVSQPGSTLPQFLWRQLNEPNPEKGEADGDLLRCLGSGHWGGAGDD